MTPKCCYGIRKPEFFACFSSKKSTNFIALFDLSDRYMISETLMFLLFLRTENIFSLNWKKPTNFIAFLDVSDQYMISETLIFLLFLRMKKIHVKKSTNFISFLNVSDQYIISETLIFLLFLRMKNIFSLMWKNQQILLLFWMFQISTWSIKRWYFYFFWEPRKYFRGGEQINIFYCFFGGFRSVHDQWNIDIFTFLRTTKIFSSSGKNQ